MYSQDSTLSSRKMAPEDLLSKCIPLQILNILYVLRHRRFTIGHIIDIHIYCVKFFLNPNFLFVYSYVGRHVSSSTATGNKSAHIREHSEMLKMAFKVI